MTLANPITEIEVASETKRILGADITKMDIEEIYRVMSFTQHVSNVCLNEIERRGELRYVPENGLIIVPDFIPESVYAHTILTR